MFSKYQDDKGYDCWLRFGDYGALPSAQEYKKCCTVIVAPAGGVVMDTAVKELSGAIREMFSINPAVVAATPEGPHISLGIMSSLREAGGEPLREGSYAVKLNDGAVAIMGGDENGVLYGVYYFLRQIGCGKSLKEIETAAQSANRLRIIEQWDNSGGDIERGYAGASIFYRDGKIADDLTRIRDYARLLASVGINGIVINNTNVDDTECRYVTDDFLKDVTRLANVFTKYGIKLFLSVGFDAPVRLGDLKTADPLDEHVADWWKKTADRIYRYIPDFGGFNVKADSENRPGPLTYGRNHVEGANMLARALKPHGGILMWRCFVYDCHTDWRDRKLDRARAACDIFKPMDGKFEDNVILQIKNGPMDFQIREAVSPLFGALEKTNVLLELQITQEYTGQQKHLCYLPTMWKEVLDFEVCKSGRDVTVAGVADGSAFHRNLGGMVGIPNIGDDLFWTGHPLAQSNLYGFGRLAWDPYLSAEEIAQEWTKLTLGHEQKILSTVVPILLNSRRVYEDYTSPLGVGWMVTPNTHYGPNVDGYEYSMWGTYHYADLRGIGVDRTVATGTGFAGQYRPEIAERYENIQDCPDDLLLFFHHVPYTHVLHSGKTVIQHIYDSHFEGVEIVKRMIKQWESLEGLLDGSVYRRTEERLHIQLKDSVEWRDEINTYFYRKSGIGDIKGRKIY